MDTSTPPTESNNIVSDPEPDSTTGGGTSSGCSGAGSGSGQNIGWTISIKGTKEGLPPEIIAQSYLFSITHSESLKFKRTIRDNHKGTFFNADVCIDATSFAFEGIYSTKWGVYSKTAIGLITSSYERGVEINETKLAIVNKVKYNTISWGLKLTSPKTEVGLYNVTEYLINFEYRKLNKDMRDLITYGPFYYYGYEGFKNPEPVPVY